MRVRLICPLLSLLIAASASGVSMEWTFVGDPGNACDSPQPGPASCVGTVWSPYHIGTYEVTNAQYAEFLNAKAADDPLGLYNPNMGDPSVTTTGRGGIARTGIAGSYAYSAITGRENMPVNWVSFYDAARFANWLNNGQGGGDTESGAYLLEGGTPVPTNGAQVTRDWSAEIFLPSEDEWYKAAYYDRFGGYFNYPTVSNTETACGFPWEPDEPNSANCGYYDLLPVGTYEASASPYGTFDQGGNAWEWNESFNPRDYGERVRRQLRGGSFQGAAGHLAAWSEDFEDAVVESHRIGFRVAAIETIPEPRPGLLLIAGLLGLAGCRRAKA